MISKVSALFSIPSWWMPDSCAKAFLPTMALFGCTAKPETVETRREMCMIFVVSTPVVYGMMSLRTRIAITTSSSAVLPARSPRPLIVHSICRAPPATAASAFAVAMPRSLWQCVAKTTSSPPSHSAMRRRIRSADSAGAV
jgi:hypothetical protein